MIAWGWGITPADTLKRLAGEGKGEMTLGSTLPCKKPVRNLPYVHPDHSLESVLRHVYQVPPVPESMAPISGDWKE